MELKKHSWDWIMPVPNGCAVFCCFQFLKKNQSEFPIPIPIPNPPSPTPIPNPHPQPPSPTPTPWYPQPPRCRGTSTAAPLASPAAAPGAAPKRPRSHSRYHRRRRTLVGRGTVERLANQSLKMCYPLVNIQKTMENHHFLWEIPL